MPYRYPLIVTFLILLAVSALLIVYDCWLYHRGGAAATISWHTYLIARVEPIIPFAVGLILGVLCGHLFWPNNGS